MSKDLKKKITKLAGQVAEARGIAGAARVAEMNLRERLAAAEAARVAPAPVAPPAPAKPAPAPVTHRQVWRDLKAQNPYLAADYLLRHATVLDEPADQPQGAA